MNTLRRAVANGMVWGVVALSATAVGIGCGKPNAANIALRKQNAELRARVDDLERRHKADLASLRGRESGTTMPSVPAEQLEQLFTVHGIRFGRLTGPADWDSKSPGDDGFKVYLTPFDNAGQQLKAAGSIVVEAFDLARGEGTRIGQWEFPLRDAARNWFGQAMLYGYVLQCPWQQRPEHADITIKASFTDALTGRVFTEQQVVKITPAASTAPAKAAG